MDTNTLVTLGAAWGAIQALAGFLTAILPNNTIAWKISKAIVSGAARPAPNQGP